MSSVKQFPRVVFNPHMIVFRASGIGYAGASQDRTPIFSLHYATRENGGLDTSRRI